MKNENSSTQGKGSNKGAIWAVSVLSIVLLAVSVVVFVTRENELKEQQAEAQLVNENLSGVIAHRDSIINDLVQTFNEIEQDMNIVREKENLLAISTEDPEFTDDVRDRILSDIREMNTLLEENRAKVKELNRRLKESGIQIEALKEKMALLEESLEQRDSSIQVLKMELVNRDFQLAEMNTVIDSLDTEVVEMGETLVQKEAVISQHEAELDKAFLASGTSKELEEKGILAKEGGFLGLGRNKVVPANIVDSYFDQISISETDKIPVNAKKVEFISDHPEDSYRVVSNDSIVQYIEIIQPEKFWKKTRYAVVETRR
jgi:uncharacterized protein (DUF3084 family)